MKKVRLIYIFPLLLGTLSSCSDVWDEKTNNEWESKYIWTVSEVAQGVLNNAYRAIPNRPDNYGNNFLDAATDNALTSLYSSSVYKLAMGKYSATDNPLGIWSSCYQQFQYINSFLENGLGDGTKYDKIDADKDAAYKKRLKGEAYFEVHKDSLRPFVVRMNGSEVTVLGTSINVNTNGDDGQIYTTLVNGSVRVSSVKIGQAEVLKPGMQSVMDVQSGQLTVREVDVEPYVAWREGRFVFRAMTLDLIMRQLQRWYDFEVFYQNPEMAEKRVGFKLEKYEHVDSLLKILE